MAVTSSSRMWTIAVPPPVARQQTPSVLTPAPLASVAPFAAACGSRRLVFSSGRAPAQKERARALRPGRDSLYPASAEALAQGALRVWNGGGLVRSGWSFMSRP